MSRYKIYIVPDAWKEIGTLPGHMRQRVKRAIESLAGDPRPSKSKLLDTPDMKITLCRLRLDRWRIVYAISEDDKIVDVLAVRKRPPYDYEDLERLLNEAL